MKKKLNRRKHSVQIQESAQYKARALNRECCSLRESLADAQQQLENVRNESHDLMQEADNELAGCREHIQDLQNQVQALELENGGLRRKLGNMNKLPLLAAGTINEFYENETKDIVLDELNQSMDHIDSKSRRFELIQDVLTANDFKNRQEQRQDHVKQILNNQRRIPLP